MKYCFIQNVLLLVLDRWVFNLQLFAIFYFIYNVSEAGAHFCVLKGQNKQIVKAAKEQKMSQDLQYYFCITVLHLGHLNKGEPRHKICSNLMHNLIYFFCPLAS